MGCGRSRTPVTQISCLALTLDLLSLQKPIKKACESLSGGFHKSGYPKSSDLMGFSLINQPFGGTPIYANPHLDTVNTSTRPSRIGGFGWGLGSGQQHWDPQCLCQHRSWVEPTEWQEIDPCKCTGSGFMQSTFWTLKCFAAKASLFYLYDLNSCPTRHFECQIHAAHSMAFIEGPKQCSSLFRFKFALCPLHSLGTLKACGKCANLGQLHTSRYLFLRRSLVSFRLSASNAVVRWVWKLGTQKNPMGWHDFPID